MPNVAPVVLSIYFIASLSASGPELDSTVVLFCLCVVAADRDFNAWKGFDDSNDVLFSW